MTTELRRGLVLAVVGLVAGFVLIGVAASGTRLFSLFPQDPVAPQDASLKDAIPKDTVSSRDPAAPATVAALPAAPVPEAPRAAPDAPTFDVIRVEPDGASVVAGRSQPGAEVELLRGGSPFARTRADAAGNFALVPPLLPPGSSEITLRSIAPDGARVTSQESAVVVVAPDGRARPLVAVTAPGKPTAVLSQPEVAAAPSAGTAPVKIVSVDAEAGGRLYVTARGAPEAALRLYLNDTLVAPGRAGPDGRIAFTIGRGVNPGDYRVRIDQVDPASGTVRTRAETAFAVPPNLDRSALAGATEAPGRAARQPLLRGAPAGEAVTAAPAPSATGAAAAASAALSPAPVRAPTAEAALAPAAPGTVFVPGVSTARVIRGDNLWSISRRAYGNGLRYTVIFDANQRQIRDPNRIYPGQVFVLPGEAPAVQGQTRESRG
ncbi:peptidoglycan-binding protein [Methylobacterium variabile]|uniref:Peptidoglycan-binding protein n=1 Tax=Methylobacterium variabile TaxID=298794 RepID=A0A0J6SSR9_9HYPH|nr:LysM peptidoglycan-binding domain-containing protein [Methylobacterium variabile]KMO36592.1 peptidoglycan-binding protein [Methylobacterium variabile]